VEQLFSTRSGKNLKPIFDLFLRTTDKLQIQVQQKKADEFDIQLLNLQMELPLEVLTAEGIKRIMVGTKPVRIKSSSLPEMDPNGYYLKRVIIE
jgi:hypothetical protein